VTSMLKAFGIVGVSGVKGVKGVKNCKLLWLCPWLVYLGKGNVRFVFSVGG
jgi:hypothetical protein